MKSLITHNQNNDLKMVVEPVCLSVEVFIKDTLFFYLPAWLKWHHGIQKLNQQFGMISKYTLECQIILWVKITCHNKNIYGVNTEYSIQYTKTTNIFQFKISFTIISNEIISSSLLCISLRRSRLIFASCNDCANPMNCPIGEDN